MIKNFVISMPNASERRQHIQQEFSRLSIPFEFFDAISHNHQLNHSMERLVPHLADTETLSPAEKGCFMSHVSLWEKCVKENYPHIAIYEDDIVLSQDAAYFLKEDNWILSTFPNKDTYFILRLETSLMKVGQPPFKTILSTTSPPARLRAKNIK